MILLSYQRHTDSKRTIHDLHDDRHEHHDHRPDGHCRKDRALRMIKRALTDDTIPMSAWIHEADRFGATDAEIEDASKAVPN